MSGKSILVTGGTGSFGRRFVRTVLAEHEPRRIVILSRDELKQYEFRAELGDDRRVRFFIGDVRERERLWRAFDEVDIVVHAAALKQVPAAEYNPFEATKTNINGAQNVIEAALDRGVERVIALSTDKASSPINLYGATKLVSDKLFTAANAYAGSHRTRFSVVRYGNVVGSRGSVVPLFRRLASSGTIPITDERMTRFWITLDQGVHFVIEMLAAMRGGELFVPKIPSMRVVDLARAMAPQARLEVVGIRPGEKLHEEMISLDDARRTLDAGGHFVMQPDAEWWDPAHWAEARPLPEGFRYTSDTNDEWLTVDQLRAMVDAL
ncbi:MAG TPA: UDP-N-acetylglucosamine 4,6-dehydratase (inverting) [Candidatus Limnocylindrales bacterium]|nr:UDP-N-acetylglucosamine 4,6-dehydratase (inverting) [Candidatus Limnocylindrales bacterium]